MDKYEILKTLYFVLTLCLPEMKGDPKESAVKKANIYYQQPLKNGEPHELSLDSIGELASKTDIKVVIHGYLGSRFHYSIMPLKNAYMAQGAENVFFADWESAASFDYAASRELVAKVGVFLAQSLEKFLNKHEIPLNEVHVIGHSLGAHIAGNIGRYFNGTLGRVTGLDPALPLFAADANDGLQSNAAIFVDVIHTGYPVFGDNTPRGTVDFYPNYGYIPQKGCDDVNLIAISKLLFETHSCSHVRAVLLYAESIGLPKSFPALPCTLAAIKTRSHELCLQGLENDNLTKTSLTAAIELKSEEGVAYMGEGVSRSASGLYYLETYGVPPYGLGLFTQAN